MKTNMGSADRVIRLLVVAVIAVLCFGHFVTGTLAIVLLVVAAIFLLTSIVGFCPLYAPFKISTKKKR